MSTNGFMTQRESHEAVSILLEEWHRSFHEGNFVHCEDPLCQSGQHILKLTKPGYIEAVERGEEIDSR